MTEIVEAPLSTTPEELVEIAIEKMQATYPNFKPNPADPEYRMFVAFAYIAAETLILGFEVPEAIIRFVGAVVYQTLPTSATFAVGKVKFVASDSLGHTVPKGTQVIVVPEGADPVGYETVVDLEIKAGQTQGEVGIQAIESGTEANVTGAAAIEPSEPFSWEQSLAIVTNPAGGASEESTEEYTKRIIELAKLLAPRPIVPEDFANFVRLLTVKEKPGRCLAIDGLELKETGGHTEVNGAGEGTVKAEGVERCVTVIAQGSTAGKPLSTAAREEAEANLKAARETTFKTFVAGPTINSVAVAVTGKTLKGFSIATVTENVEAALRGYLNSGTWGQPKSGDTSRWLLKKTLRRQAIVDVLLNTEGFSFYTNLKINGTEAEEYTLTGIAPLAEAGALTVTLTEGTDLV